MTPELIEHLKKLADFIYAEDMDTVSPANWLAIMESLDDAADYINDYLTDNNFNVSHNYPDIGRDKVQ